MLWQLRCHCNLDQYDRFSSTVVAIFPNVCLWRRSLCSNLAFTLKNCIEPPSYASTAYVVAIWPSFLFFCKNLGHLREFLCKWFTAPLGKKFPVRLCYYKLLQSHLLRHFPYQNLSRTETRSVIWFLYVMYQCCWPKFQSIFSPCNPLQQTTGNNINIKLWGAMDHYFWNSIDAKEGFSFLKRKQIAWHSPVKLVVYKDTALSWVELLLIVWKGESYLSKSLTVCTDGGDIVESADKGMKVLVTGQSVFSWL